MVGRWGKEDGERESGRGEKERRRGGNGGE